jgi:preprotein translocase YajC subunit
MDILSSPAFAADSDAAGAPAAAAGSTAATESVPYELTPEKMMQDNLLILAVLFFIFYFLLIKPQKKRIKQHSELMKSLQKGNKVITSGGIIGTIIKFEGEDVVVLEVSQGVRVRMAKSSISEIAGDKVASGESANDN